jgi:cytoskeleton protein RodZ
MQIKAREDSWVEVSDAQGQVLFSRLLRGGEQASLNVQPPLRLRVGNVAGTDILLRGSPVDLAAQARDNVLRMELK